METHKTRQLVFIGIVVLLVAAVVAPLVIWMGSERLHATPLGALVRSDLPMLDLRLQFIDLKGEAIPPEQLRVFHQGESKEAPAPAEGCTEIIGGDDKNASTLSDVKDIAPECPKVATWRVKRHPIAFSLNFQDAKKILALLDGSSPIHELLATKFSQGVFYDLLHSASIRAEDLRLEGLEGAFLARFIRESLAAHAELHYDSVHGKKGFVYSFARSECPFASKALPVVSRVLVRSGYRIPGLEDPVLEMRIGLQRLFLTQVKDRVYLANGLEALLNVLESLDPPEKPLPKTPLVLTVRAQAFVDRLLPVMVGSATEEVNLGFDLSEETPGVLQFKAGKLAKQLHPKIFKGVFAGIPHDAFAAVATSFYLPPGMTDAEWKQLASSRPGDQAPAGPKGPSGPEEAGVALVWEVSAGDGGLTDIGVVIANQTTPREADSFERYFAHSELTAKCGDGTVFLAASSQGLLTRMRESCAGQSLSVLDWERGGRRESTAGAQLLLFMNPGTGMRELLLAGGARSGDLGDFEPRWKQQVERAKEAVRTEGEKVFGTLPIFAYSGSAAPAADWVQLNGFLVKQGASR